MTDEYMTIAEVAALLRCKAKTIRNKMSSGIFRLGVHYFRPAGFDPLFKRNAVIELIEGREASGTELDPRNCFPVGQKRGNGHLRGLHS
jgi:hypothetical protein